jgi:hypothetical protein
MPKPTRYVGIHKDKYGGMTDIGRMIRDAWVFGILPEDETCEGWDLGRIEQLYDAVHKAWLPYGHLVSKLTPELRERHARIYAEAVERAHAQGWDTDLAHEDDD